MSRLEFTEGDFSPTPEWTNEDRITVAAQYALELTKYASDTYVLRADLVKQVASTIGYVLSADSHFLESNRETILNNPLDNDIQAEGQTGNL